MAEGGWNPEVSNAKPPWKIGLDQCRVDICNDLQPLEVLPNLQARGVISQPMIDTIKAHPIRYNQNEALVTWLQTGPEETFEVFCEILRGTTQSHIEANIRSKISDIKARQSIAENVEEINGSIDLPLSADHMKVIKSQIMSDDQKKRHLLLTLVNDENRKNRMILRKFAAITSCQKGFIAVTGGKAIEGPTNVSFLYDIGLDKWMSTDYIPNMKINIHNHFLFEYNGCLWAMGGTTSFTNIIFPQRLNVLSVSHKIWLSSPIVSSSKNIFSLVGVAIFQQEMYGVGVYKDKSMKGWITIMVMEKDFVWHEVSTWKSDNYSGFATLNNKIYFCGRCDEQDSGLVYDLSTKLWSKMVSTNHSKRGYKTVVLKGSIVVIGGSESGICERYDPTKNKWENMTNLLHTVTNPAVATDGEMIFVIGGVQKIDGHAKCTKLLQIYDYRNNEWKDGAEYPIQISETGAAFLSAEMICGEELYSCIYGPVILFEWLTIHFYIKDILASMLLEFLAPAFHFILACIMILRLLLNVIRIYVNGENNLLIDKALGGFQKKICDDVMYRSLLTSFMQFHWFIMLYFIQNFIEYMNLDILALIIRLLRGCILVTFCLLAIIRCSGKMMEIGLHIDDTVLNLQDNLETFTMLILKNITSFIRPAKNEEDKKEDKISVTG